MTPDQFERLIEELSGIRKALEHLADRSVDALESIAGDMNEIGSTTDPKSPACIHVKTWEG